MSQAEHQLFQETVWDYYGKHGRDLPWRHSESDGSFDPYKILVSELMLQQTQVTRVIPKYQEFLGQFPDVKTLAKAKLAAVLSAWNGLGYNRRAKYLRQAAQQIMAHQQGEFPKTLNALITLPGVGKNTAGAILAYAFNQPAVFVETNIRTVYIHHFFNDQFNVSDQQIITWLEQTIDKENPRLFFWTLMDYGAYLKQNVGNNISRSKHYKKQSVFNGSQRQIRGQVIRLLMGKSYSRPELQQHIADQRLHTVLQDLVSEGLVMHSRNQYRLG